MIALAGVVLVLLATSKYGASITSLSSAYLDAANSLAKGKGFVFHTGEPMVLWPPLYSMLLAVVALVTGLEPVAFVHIVNAVLFAAVVCLTASLFRPDLTSNAVYSVLGVCAVLFSVPLSLVYATAWSECLFIPLILLYLVFAQRYWECHDGRSLAVMTISAALACLTRYIGVSLVLAGTVTIVFASGVGLRTRFVRASAFASLSLLPLGVWCLRNQLLIGAPAGPRAASTTSLSGSVIDSMGAVLPWYTFGLASELIVLAWVAVLAVRIPSSGIPATRLSASLKVVSCGRLPTLMFVAAYMIVLFVTSGATELDQMDGRLLSPVYVPATLVLLEFGLRLFGPAQSHSPAIIRSAPSLFLAAWLCFPLASMARSTSNRMRNGAGAYNSDAWHGSQTVAFVKTMRCVDGQLQLYSNAADALWELARLEAHELPSRSVVNLRDLSRRWPAADPAAVVWFNRRSFRGYFTVQELESIADIEEVARLDDGSVYRVSIREELPATGR